MADKKSGVRFGICTFVCLILAAAPGFLPAVAADSAFQDAASQPAVLPHCPIMTTEEIDPDVFVDWHGKRIYFCCNKCKTKFQHNPEEYSAVAAAFPVLNLGGPPITSATTSMPAAGAESGGGVGAADAAAVAARPFFPRLINWLGRFHPATIHFPIGLLFAALVAELLFAWRKNAAFDNAARFCAVVGCIGGLLSGALGWCFGGFEVTEDDGLLMWHRWLGTGAAAGFIVLLVVTRRLRTANFDRAVFRLILLVVTGLVLAAGYLGGNLVWGANHLDW